jgi:hypothetical protein
VNLTGSVQGPVEGSCKYGYEPSGFGFTELVLYVFESCILHWGNNTQRVFRNTVVRRIFEPKRDKVSGG